MLDWLYQLIQIVFNVEISQLLVNISTPNVQRRFIFSQSLIELNRGSIHHGLAAK